MAGLSQSFREDQLTLSELVHDGEKDRLLAWFVRSAYHRNGDDWMAICETEPELASRVWEATAVGSDELVIWDVVDRQLIRFTPSSAQLANFNSPELDQIVPAVDDDWKIELIDPTD